MNFIVIDDERAAANFAGSLVSAKGHTAEVHYSRATAIKAFSAKPNWYHGAVIDVFLDPGLGTDLIDEFRIMRPDLPCMIISGISDPYNVERLQVYGPFLNKPYFPQTFMALFAVLADLAERQGG